jgi:DNA-binding response OmpR family regulator
MRIGLFHTDPGESSRLASVLARHGYAPAVFSSGEALDAAIAHDHFDLLLLRWDGHPLSGIALAHRARKRQLPSPGVILLVDSKAPGGIGELGDIALPDPCDDTSLLPAIDAVTAGRGVGTPAGLALRFDDERKAVLVQGAPVQLTAKEYALARLLLSNVGKPLTRNEIMISVWGRTEKGGSRTLDAHIAQVRKRLLLRPENGWRLSSVYGYGYRLDQVVDSLTEQAA